MHSLDFAARYSIIGVSICTIVDTWRFWIIHLWIKGFFELFATVMATINFYKLGIVSHTTAARVVQLDAILYLGDGIVEMALE